MRLICSLVFLFACGDCNREAGSEPSESTAQDEAEPTPAEQPEPIKAIQAVDVNMDKVTIGRRLFHDPILSGDGTVSCSSCHSLAHGGAEPRRTSTGINGQVGPINSPTVLNAHFNFRQFWDGRAADLQEQAGGPVENPIEMGATFAGAIERITADAWYAEHFQSVYEGSITKENITDAIAEYERYLITPGAVDRFLNGDETALNEQQQRGYATFKEAGCTACHQGENVGGTMYQKMGVVRDYFELRGGERTEADNGRFNVTQDESDRYFFKVPTLRNIAQTAPYFHDGSQAELAGAVRIMAQVQLGKDLSDNEVADIVSFLEALSGELPADAAVPDTDAIPPRSDAATEAVAAE